MSNFLNIFLTVLFFAMGAWMIKGYVVAGSKTQYREKMWTVMNMIMVAFGGLSVITFFVDTDPVMMLRNISILLIILGFVLPKDGIGEDGIACAGKFYTWREVTQYDYADGEKNFCVYFKSNVVDDGVMTVNLQKEDKEGIIKFLDGNFAKKHKRIRKA